MTPFNKMRGVAVIAVVAIILVAGFFLWSNIEAERDRQEIKPWVTYGRLLYYAEKCDQYREQTGEWPGSLSQLVAVGAEVGAPWCNDAWGRGVTFEPYDKLRGYGAVVSYGRDGKPGGVGDDRDFEVRFPTKANEAWNKHEALGLKAPEGRP